MAAESHARCGFARSGLSARKQSEFRDSGFTFAVAVFLCHGGNVAWLADSCQTTSNTFNSQTQESVLNQRNPNRQLENRAQLGSAYAFMYECTIMPQCHYIRTEVMIREVNSNSWTGTKQRKSRKAIQFQPWRRLRLWEALVRLALLSWCNQSASTFPETK